MKLLAVINITDYNEPIENALNSIVSSKELFCGVQIVSQGGPGVLNDKYKTLLEKYEIPYSVGSKLGKLPTEADAIVEIPPLCEVDPLGFKELIENTKSKSKDVNKTHFSLATGVFDNTFSFTYGWLFVLYIIELAWSSYEWFKLPLKRYVRLTYILKKGNQKVLAEWQFGWRFRNTGQEKTLYRPGWATIMLEPRLRGWSFVKNSIFRHEQVGNWRCMLGNWWFILW
jgi:hypothetical protein